MSHDFITKKNLLYTIYQETCMLYTLKFFHTAEHGDGPFVRALAAGEAKFLCHLAELTTNLMIRRSGLFFPRLVHLDYATLWQCKAIHRAD